MSVCKFRWLCVCLPRATFLDAATKLRLPYSISQLRIEKNESA